MAKSRIGLQGVVKNTAARHRHASSNDRVHGLVEAELVVFVDGSDGPLVDVVPIPEAIGLLVDTETAAVYPRWSEPTLDAGPEGTLVPSDDPSEATAVFAACIAPVSSCSSGGVLAVGLGSWDTRVVPM